MMNQNNAQRFSQAKLLLIVLLALAFALASGLLRDEKPAAVGDASLTGFEVSDSGSIRANDTPTSFHAYSLPIGLASGAYYRIQYDIVNLPRSQVFLTTDFYAPDYDNPAQEKRRTLGMRALGQRQSMLFNTGSAPPNAHLRVFYSGPPGLEIRNIQVVQIATWSVWLTWTLRLCAAFTFLVSLALVYRRSRSWNAPRPDSIGGCAQHLATEMPALIAIYLLAILARYITYLFIPYWSGDEYVYKAIAAGIWQLGSHSALTSTMIAHAVDLPNLLYPYLIAPSFSLGDGFYHGIRLTNSIVMNLAIFPSYLLARKFMSSNTALATAAMCIAIPFVNIGAFAVTEALFFPLFVFSAWIAYESVERLESHCWAIMFGVLSALLLNTRLNALVLLPAYLLAYFWIAIRQGQFKSVVKRPCWLSAVVAFSIVHGAIQLFLRTTQSGDLGLYADMATNNQGPIAVLRENPWGLVQLIAGHLSTLAIPYALPIALMAYCILPIASNRSLDRSFQNFLIMAAVFAAALFALSIVFTVSVAPTDLGGLGRWHSRYYFYAYPLIIITAAAIATRFDIEGQNSRLAIGFIAGSLILVSVWFVQWVQSPWFGSIVDNMDVQWYRSARQFRWPMVILSVFLIVLWLKRSRHFRTGMIGLFASWAIVSNYGTLKYADFGGDLRQTGLERQTGVQTLSSTCGVIAYQFLDKHPGRFQIVGDSRINMVAAAFWTPFVPARTILHTDPASVFSPMDVTPSADYLIVNGKILVTPPYYPLVSRDGCSIYELRN